MDSDASISCPNCFARIGFFQKTFRFGRDVQCLECKSGLRVGMAIRGIEGGFGGLFGMIALVLYLFGYSILFLLIIFIVLVLILRFLDFRYSKIWVKTDNSF